MAESVSIWGMRMSKTDCGETVYIRFIYRYIGHGPADRCFHVLLNRYVFQLDFFLHSIIKDIELYVNDYVYLADAL